MFFASELVVLVALLVSGVQNVDCISVCTSSCLFKKGVRRNIIRERKEKEKKKEEEKEKEKETEKEKEKRKRKEQEKTEKKEK